MKTSKGICIVKEYDDSVYYKATCDCLSNECIHTISLDYQRDTNTISMDLYAKVGTYDSWYEDVWYYPVVKLYKRIDKALRILFLGYIEVENSFFFGDEEKIQDYINALQEGLEKMKKENCPE